MIPQRAPGVQSSLVEALGVWGQGWLSSSVCKSRNVGFILEQIGCNGRQVCVTGLVIIYSNIKA